MKRLIIFAVVLLAAVGGTSSAVLGGTSESFFDVDPTSAPPGGTVTVTGVCPVDDVNQWEGVFFYLDIPDAMDDEPEFFHLDNFPITPGVQWTFELTIPAEARPGETTIAKQCARLNDDGSFGGGEFLAQRPILRDHRVKGRFHLGQLDVGYGVGWRRRCCRTKEEREKKRGEAGVDR